MFDNVNWNGFINSILSYLDKNWKCLIIKADISQTSYSPTFYYSKNNKDFFSLYNVMEKEKMDTIFDNTISALKKITENFVSCKESMFLTIKVEKNGNVKVIYRNIKEANKLPYDESRKYLELNEHDKLI